MIESVIEIFISCSQDLEDRDLRDKLEKQLGLLMQEGLINVWHKDKVHAGIELEQEIHTHLNKAHIILLLISASFIASYSCYSIEMKRAMERYDAEEARVIPILLRPVVWQGAPFDKLQVLPTNNMPVTSWSNIDEALLDVTKGIREVIEELQISQQWQDAIVTAVDSTHLYNSLVRLDYREQATIFQQFKDKKRQVGAFLIYGAPSYGQGWLLNRLVMSLPNISAGVDFKFSFERKACGRSLKDLWGELAKWVGLKNLPFPMDLQSQQEVVKRVHRMWQRHTVILILSKLHEIDEQYLDRFLREFWLPLAQMAMGIPSQSPKHYLLMFLIDNTNCVDKWNQLVAKEFDQNWEPRIPIKLGKLTQFSYDMLHDWIGYEFETLGSNLTVQDILDNSEDGIPEFVLDHVCGLFGYDWLRLVKYRA